MQPTSSRPSWSACTATTRRTSSSPRTVPLLTASGIWRHVWGDGNPRFTDVSAANGSWEVKADLSLWADKIAAERWSGVIRRAEIAVMPELKDAATTVLGLNAPSKTFNLAANALRELLPRSRQCIQDGQPEHEWFDWTDATPVTTSLPPPSIAESAAATSRSAGSATRCRMAVRIWKRSRGRSIPMSMPSTRSRRSIRVISTTTILSRAFGSMRSISLITSRGSRSRTARPATSATRPMFTRVVGVRMTCRTSPSRCRACFPGPIRSTAGTVGPVSPAVTGPAVRACGACHRAQAINADDEGRLSTQIAALADLRLLHRGRRC